MQCPQCGSGIVIGQPSCPRCGASRPTLPPRFAETERAFLTLYSRFRAGQIDATTYRAELHRLSFKDETGRYWTINTDGEWYLYHNQQWIRYDPPAQPAARPAPQQQPRPVEPRRRPAPAAQRTTPAAADKPRRGRWPLIGCAALAIILIVAVGVTLVLGRQEYRSSPMLVENVVPGQAGASYSLSAAQQEAVGRLGYPESFAILFFQEIGTDGSVHDVRFETWTYYSQRVELSFINGEPAGEDPIELPIAKLVPLPYRPEQFSAYMSLDQVLAAASLDRYLVIPAEEAMVKDAQVYFGNQLSFGLQEDELSFIETLALETEQ